MGPMMFGAWAISLLPGLRRFLERGAGGSLGAARDHALGCGGVVPVLIFEPGQLRELERPAGDFSVAGC